MEVKFLEACEGVLLDMLVHDLMIQALPVYCIKILFCDLHQQHLSLVSNVLLELNSD